MKEVFQFSANEITKILYQELVRTGKVKEGRCGITTRYVYTLGRFDGIIIDIGDVVPGANEL